MDEQTGSIGAITDTTDWRGPDMAGRSDWIRQITDAHMDEVRSALAGVTANGLQLGAFGKEDFPIPSFAEELAWVQEQLQTGPGFALLRGFPVDDFTVPELRLIYWGIGCIWAPPGRKAGMGT